MRARLTGLVGAISVAAVLAYLPGVAQAYDCGNITYYYDVPGDSYSYYATFAGLTYHGGISVHGMRCSDARSFVRRYARVGLTDPTSRTDWEPPRSLTRFRCHRVRDGDDVGRDYCVRGRMQVFFSDYIGGFVGL